MGELRISLHGSSPLDHQQLLRIRRLRCIVSGVVGGAQQRITVVRSDLPPESFLVHRCLVGKPKLTGQAVFGDGRKSLGGFAVVLGEPPGKGLQQL